jgi:hypothetical protein
VVSKFSSFLLRDLVVISSNEYYTKDRHKYEDFLYNCSHLIGTIYRITFFLLRNEIFKNLNMKLNLNFKIKIKFK